MKNFVFIVFCLLLSCQEHDNSNLDNELKDNCISKRKVEFNGWDPALCVKGRSVRNYDYNRIIFHITSKAQILSNWYDTIQSPADSFPLVAIYATKKCYDISNGFLSENCSFYFDMAYHADYDILKHEIVNMFVDANVSPHGSKAIYFSRQSATRIGIKVPYFQQKYGIKGFYVSRIEWDRLEKKGLLKNVKFIEDLPDLDEPE